MMIDFSIIIPTYNNEKKIERALKSIKAQTFSNWELIVVDDGSTDMTIQVIDPYLSDTRIRYVKQQNKGVAVARDTGVGNALGKYLAFLDSDDEAKPRWLQDFDQLKGPDTGYISCGYTLGGKDYDPRIKEGISEHTYSSLAGTFALRKSIYEGIGGYDHNLKQGENYEMTARAVEYCERHDLKVVYTNQCNLVYHHSKTPEQTRERDRLRAEASLYLYKKYHDRGILHFRKGNYLKSSAVNFARSGNLKKSRKIFRKILKEQPSLKNLLSILVFEIPLLRRKVWMRKFSSD